MEILINTLPLWIPIFNLIISVIIFSLTLYLIKKQPHERILLTIVLAMGVVLLGGAIFQLNLIGISTWIVVGTGGRVLAAAFLAIEVLHVIKGRLFRSSSSNGQG